jgi:peptide/nickel transport system substrate-binding protein
MAIDIPAMISALHLDEYAEPAGGPYSPLFSLLYDPQGQAPLAYNQAEAIRILEQKGWVLGADSVRVKDGRRLSFTIATNAGNQRRADIGQIAQQAWRRIGVEARFQTFESTTFFDRLQKKEYEAAIAGWGVGLSADIKDQWQGDNVFNYTSYANPEVNRLFEQAASQRTEEQAAQYWKQAASLIVADQPYTWLFYFDQLAGVNDKIQNTRIDTLGMYQNIHEWWIRGLAADQVAQDGNGGS